MFEPVKLSAKHASDWEKSKTTLSWCCPGFTHVLHNMLNTVGQETIALFTEDARFPIAATDGATLILRPSTFFALNLMERLFVINHEILHCIWNHCGMSHQIKSKGYVAYPNGTTLPYVHKIMNIAMDLVINDLLIESNKTQGCCVGHPPKGIYHDPKIATHKDSVIDAYRKVYEKAKKDGRILEHYVGFDEHLDPGEAQGKDPSQAERNEGEWAAAIAAAANVQRLQGKMSAALDRFFKEILSPQVDWRDKIRALFARRLGSGGYDWRKPDRRLIVRDIYAPARSGHGVGSIVWAVDTSGSIGERDHCVFAGEGAGILGDCRPRILYALECDAHVHRVTEMTDPEDMRAWLKSPPKGGGGTSFIPVFEWIREQGIEPDALVYLTDGMGSFPRHAPSYPVIWGNIYPEAKYPFGDVVDVPKQA